jgi:hypothetical protein
LFLAKVEALRKRSNAHGPCRLEGSAYQDFLALIPPPAEQHRIVAKVDELMALRDRLEAQLTISETGCSDESEPLGEHADSMPSGIFRRPSAVLIAASDFAQKVGEVGTGGSSTTSYPRKRVSRWGGWCPHDGFPLSRE